MDPDTIILDISSDEETTTDNDDHKWLTELLDEVSNDADVARNHHKFNDIDDDDDDDDDCVVLESDPNESSSGRNGSNDANNGEEEDEIVVVAEKGQVACRDYPHSRHLCIKFPFATTPNQNHCEKCYCYVCDSLAPCVYWGTGSGATDHCHANDKDELWELARKNTIKGTKGDQPVHKFADASLSNRQHPVVVQRPTPLLVRRQNQIAGPGSIQPLVQHQNQISGPGSIHAVQRSDNFRRIITDNGNRLLLSMKKLHPDLVSQMSAKKNAARARKDQMRNLGTQNQMLFKRTVSSVGVGTTAIRKKISSHRGNFGNGSGRQNYHVSGMISGSSLQHNAVNTSVPYPSQSLTVNNPPLPPQRQFNNHLNLNVQSQVNTNASPQSQQYRSPAVNNPALPPRPLYTSHLNLNVESHSNLSPSQRYRASTVNNPPLPPRPQFANHLNPNVESHVSCSAFHGNLQYPASHLVPPSTSQPQISSSQPSYTVLSNSAPSQTQLNSSLVSVSDDTQNFSLANEAQSVVKDFLKDYGLDLPTSKDSGTVEGAGPVNESPVPCNLADYQYDWIFENLPDAPELNTNGTYGLTDLSSDSSFIDTGPIFDL